MYNVYVQTKPHNKTLRIERNEIVNKIVISKNYLATKKHKMNHFTVFENMKSLDSTCAKENRGIL